jgi:hypothetical protein
MLTKPAPLFGQGLNPCPQRNGNRGITPIPIGARVGEPLWFASQAVKAWLRDSTHETGEK